LWQESSIRIKIADVSEIKLVVEKESLGNQTETTQRQLNPRLSPQELSQKSSDQNKKKGLKNEPEN
jgi:hypothetical protein